MIKAIRLVAALFVIASLGFMSVAHAPKDAKAQYTKGYTSEDRADDYAHHGVIGGSCKCVSKTLFGD
jgi:hypothetical protein